MLIKTLIAAGILFYMFLFWLFKQPTYEPKIRPVVCYQGNNYDGIEMIDVAPLDKGVITYNEALRCLTLQKGETHENP